MTLLYLDSSAWVKRYFVEAGSDWILRLFENGSLLASSVLGHIEVVSAVARQQVSRKVDGEKIARLQLQLEEDWKELTGLPLTDEVADRAVPVGTNVQAAGADVVHLATALVLSDSLKGTGNSLVLIASDHELLSAAQQVGLATQNPIFAAPS